MLSALAGFLHDHLVWLILVTLVAWAWFASAILRNRQPLAVGAAGARPGAAGRQPVSRAKDIVPQQRTSTGGLAPSIEAGMAEHTQRSAAATAKLSPQAVVDEKRRPTEASLKPIKSPPPLPTPDQLKDAADRGMPRPSTTASAETATDDDAMAGLFEGLKDKDGPTAEKAPSSSAQQRASRIEELGFHHPIEPTPQPPAPTAEKQVAPVTPLPVSAPPKPRTQTAELDDILKRIDKVLAENPSPGDKPAAPPPAAAKPAPRVEASDVLKRIDQALAAQPAMPPAEKPATPLPVKPPEKPAEKLDPSDVLKRIDQALAESRHGTAAEVTMLDPDWADEAKRAATEPAAPTKPPEKAETHDVLDHLDRVLTERPSAPAERTMHDPGWEDEAKRAATADAVPKPPSPPAPVAKPAEKQTNVPDWARADAEDEKDDKDQGKGGGPSQQKLF